MSKHTIIIMCCSMSAIWLAATSTYHLHSDSLQNFTVLVAELVSSKPSNAQKLILESLFGHRDSDSSVFRDDGRFMKHLLQSIVPVSKCATNLLDESFTACTECLLVYVLKEFTVQKPNMDRKRFAYLVLDKTRKLFVLDMKNVLEIFLNMSLPGGMEKYNELYIYLPMTTLTDKLKFFEKFCLALSMSPKNYNLDNKSKMYVLLRIHHLNGKTKNSVVYIVHHLNSKTKYMSSFLKKYEASIVIDNGILKAQIFRNSQHKFPTSFVYEVNNLDYVDRISHRHQAGSKTSQSYHLVSTTLSFVHRVSQLSFNAVSRVIHVFINKQQKLSSTFTRHSSDYLNFSKRYSEFPTRIQHHTSLWNHVTPSNCDPQVLPCTTEVHARKRSSSLDSELDTEFAHLPKAALKFLSYSSTSCPEMTEPMIHDTVSPVMNSLPIQLSWLPYQNREPSRGCRTKLWTQINPVRLWPRILLLAKCMCDGSRCARHGPHKCTTIKVAVVSLIRDTREDGDQATHVRRQKEMLPVGCVCSEQKSVLLREHQPHILV